MKSVLFRRVTPVIFLIVTMLCCLTACTFDLATTEPSSDLSNPTFTPSQGLLYEVNKDEKSCTVVGLGSCTDTEVYILLPATNK